MKTPHTPQGLPPLPKANSVRSITNESFEYFTSADMKAYAREALRAQAASVEPVLYASPKQLSAAIAGTLSGFENLKPEFGGYLPVRTEQGGLFTSPLYTSTPPSQASVPASDVIEAIEAWKSAHMRIPPLADRVNKATREAITLSHSPLFQLLNLAQQAKRMPTQCPTPAGCAPHGCHGACLDESQHPTPSPAQADAASEAFTGITNDDAFWTELTACLARATLTAKDRK